MLDIVITHYKEPYEVGKKLFQMIDLQRFINFDDIKVIVINDGGNMLPQEELDRFGYPIEQVNIPHGGISAARNAGIEHGTNEWIMFCDFDDMFVNVYALHDILSILPAKDFDFLWTQIMVEDNVYGYEQLCLSPERQKLVFVHGKVYRRKYLIDNDFKFKVGMNFQEDSLFNATIIAKLDFHRIGQIKTPMPSYAWIRRENSVTNSGREEEATYAHFMRNLFVTEENKDDYDRYCGMITRTAYDTYYMIKGHRIGKEMKEKILSEFIPWIRERITEFGRVDARILEQIQDVSSYELVDKGDIIPDSYTDVSNWIKQIMNGKE